MKKFFSAIVCIALTLSFALSVSAAGPVISIVNWSTATMDAVPKVTPLPSDAPTPTPTPVGNPTPTPIADLSLVQCINQDYGGDSAEFIFTVVDFDGGKGVQIKNGANVNSGQAIFDIFPNRPDLTDLSGVDTIRVRIKTDCTQDNLGLWFQNGSLHSAIADGTVLYDMNHKEVDPDTKVWGVIPALPAGFDGYIIIDLNTLTPQPGNVSTRPGTTAFSDIQSNFMDASAKERWTFQFMVYKLGGTGGDPGEGMLPGESITVGSIDLVSSDDMWAVGESVTVPTAAPVETSGGATA